MTEGDYRIKGTRTQRENESGRQSRKGGGGKCRSRCRMQKVPTQGGGRRAFWGLEGGSFGVGGGEAF